MSVSYYRKMEKMDGILSGYVFEKLEEEGKT